jgi:phospholipid/cholesterol/gamma-HCH transport system substrate-binding protein
MVNRTFTVGLFAIAGLTLFTVGLFLVGNRHEAFARHMDFYAEFTNLAGLSKGAKVQVAGMNAGQILDIAIPDSPSSRFRLKLRVNEKLHGLVRTDSVATIGTEGVVGDTFVLILPGSLKAPAAAAQSTLPSKEPTEIAELLDEGKGVLADVDGTVKQANGILTTVGGRLNSTLDGVKTQYRT